VATETLACLATSLIGISVTLGLIEFFAGCMNNLI
jgi:hypothetical protein